MEHNGHRQDDGADMSDPVRQEVQSSGPPRVRRVTTASFSFRPPAEGLLPPREPAVSRGPGAPSAPGPEYRFPEAGPPSTNPSTVIPSGTLLGLGVVLLAVVFAAGLLLGQLTADGPERASIPVAQLRLPPTVELSGASSPIRATPLESDGPVPLPEPPTAAGTAVSPSAPAPYLAPIASRAEMHRTWRSPVQAPASSERAARRSVYRQAATHQDARARFSLSTRRPAGAMGRYRQPYAAAHPVRPKSLPVTTARTWSHRVTTTSRNVSVGTGYNQRVLQVLDRLR